MIVIGAGRVGQALQRIAEREGLLLDLVSRTAGWEVLDAPHGRPILVATRNDDLTDVLSRIPEERRDDLVFIQNGMLRPFLAEQGLEHTTRGLLFFAVPTRDAEPVRGPASPFCGPRATSVSAWLEAAGLGARVVAPSDFAEIELEKLVWNCAFGLMCQVHEATVGEVVSEHRDELTTLIAELVAVGSAALGTERSSEQIAEANIDYSLQIPDYRGAVKEWRWRNGWFLETAERLGIDTPRHRALLDDAGVGTAGAC